MCKIDFNLQKSIEIVNHIKLDSRFLIDCNRLSVVKSDLCLKFIIISKNRLKSSNTSNHIQELKSIVMEYLFLNLIYVYNLL